MIKTVTIDEEIFYVYADLEDARVYNMAIVGSTWAEKDEKERSQRLVQATRKIDSYSYAGEKVDPNQPLKFPRVTATGKTSDDEVLTNLCCQIAAFYNDNGGSSSGGDSGSFLNNVENYQIGDLHVKFKDDATLDLSGIDDFIEGALKDWLSSQGMEIWL